MLSAKIVTPKKPAPKDVTPIARVEMPTSRAGLTIVDYISAKMYLVSLVYPIHKTAAGTENQVDALLKYLNINENTTFG